jgi:hypothetical protein
VVGRIRESLHVPSHCGIEDNLAAYRLQRSDSAPLQFGAVLEAQPNWRRARKLLPKLRRFNSFDDIHSGNLAQWEDHGG